MFEVQSVTLFTVNVMRHAMLCHVILCYTMCYLSFMHSIVTDCVLCCLTTHNIHCTAPLSDFVAMLIIQQWHAIHSLPLLSPISYTASLITITDTCSPTHRPVIKVGDVYDMLKNVQHHCFPIGTYGTARCDTGRLLLSSLLL